MARPTPSGAYLQGENPMTKVYAPDGACKEMDVNGRRYRQRNYDGPFVVDSARDARTLIQAGCFQGTLTPYSRSNKGGCRVCGGRVFIRPADATPKRCCACGTPR